MKFKTHVLAQLPVLIISAYFLGWLYALIIITFQFIPSLDYFMEKINFHKEMHRKLFHNVFAMIMPAVPVYFFFGHVIASVGCINFMLHIIMDLSQGGVKIFYPLSDYSLKINNG